MRQEQLLHILRAGLIPIVALNNGISAIERRLGSKLGMVELPSS